MGKTDAQAHIPRGVALLGPSPTIRPLLDRSVRRAKNLRHTIISDSTKTFTKKCLRVQQHFVSEDDDRYGRYSATWTCICRVSTQPRDNNACEMVKKRAGSRRGQTKLTGGAKKAARRAAGRTARGAHVGEKLVLHAALRESWDERRTLRGNLARAGLRGVVNDMAEVRGVGGARGRGAGKKKGEGAVVVPETLRRMEAEAAVGEREAHGKVYVQPGVKRSLAGMVAKHGDDWEAMARDIKLNYLQWTPRQLQNKVEKMNAALARA